MKILTTFFLLSMACCTQSYTMEIGEQESNNNESQEVSSEKLQEPLSLFKLCLQSIIREILEAKRPYRPFEPEEIEERFVAELEAVLNEANPFLPPDPTPEDVTSLYNSIITVRALSRQKEGPLYRAWIAKRVLELSNVLQARPSLEDALPFPLLQFQQRAPNQSPFLGWH